MEGQEQRTSKQEGTYEATQVGLKRWRVPLSPLELLALFPSSALPPNLPPHRFEPSPARLGHNTHAHGKKR